MFIGTSLPQSIPASAPWLSTTVSPPHIASSPTSPPALTTVTDVHILPFPAATVPTTAAPVVINVHADVTLSHYAHFYDAALPSFQPTYYAMADGSLLSQAYVDEMTVSKSPVFVSGALCVFYLRNACKSLLFLRRTRVKDTTLFYLLVLSQFFGLVAAVMGAVGLLDMGISCQTVGAIRKVFTKLSGDTMIAGIIGVKAYRCLGNNRLVLIFLFLMTATMWTLEGLEVANYTAGRSRYGVCEDTCEQGYLSLIILTEFVESAVLCACFCFAVWKSYRTRASSRLTISAAEEDKLYQRNDAKDTAEGTQSPRGWWDYVPETRPDSTNRTRLRVRVVLYSIMECIRRLWPSDDFPPGVAYQRKPSLPGEFPLPQPRRPVTSQTSSRSILRRFSHISSCPWVVAMRRRCHHFFGRHLFQKMLRNELFYTTMVAVFFMALSIAFLVGIHSRTVLGVQQWVTLNWVIVSMCTMYSFSRVMRRHELESVLQHPAAWDRMLRTDGDYLTVFYGSGPRRTRSSEDSSTSRSPPRIRTQRSNDGSVTFRPYPNPSQDAPLSSYTMSPITPSVSRKPSAASSLSSLPFQQPVSPRDTTFRTPSDMLTPPSYPPPLPSTRSLSRFPSTLDSHPDALRHSTHWEAPRLLRGSRRYSLDAWTDQRTNIDFQAQNRFSRNSS